MTRSGVPGLEQGVAVRPEFVAALCSGTRARPDQSHVAAVARILGVPVSYFDGRAVRLSTDAATGRQVVVEELRNSAGQPNPRLLPALCSITRKPGAPVCLGRSSKLTQVVHPVAQVRADGLSGARG